MRYIFVLIAALFTSVALAAKPSVQKHVIQDADCQALRADLRDVSDWKHKGLGIPETNALLMTPVQLKEASYRARIPTTLKLADTIQNHRTVAEEITFIGEAYTACLGMVGMSWYYFN